MGSSGSSTRQRSLRKYPNQTKQTTAEECFFSTSQSKQRLLQNLAQTRKKFQTCVEIIVDSSNRRTGDLSKQVYDFKVSLEMNQKEPVELKISCKTRSLNCNETWTDLDTICKSLITISDKTEYLEGRSRHHNIAVDGIKESVKEKV